MIEFVGIGFIRRKGGILANLTLREDWITTGVEASTREEVFKVLAQPLYDAGFVREGFLEGVEEREKNFPTGLPTVPFGVAIPHTNPQYVKDNAISVGVLKHPVTFTVMGTDDETTEVRLVFLLALNESQKQLNILKNITSIISDENFLKSFLTMTRKEIYEVLKVNLGGVI